MAVVFCVGLTCDESYQLVGARFEILGYGISALSMVRGKSLTEERKM